MTANASLSCPLAEEWHALLRRNPALVLVRSPRRARTVGEVGACAERLARVLPEAGSIVALSAPNGPWFLAALLALRQRGCVVALLDARAPAAERRRIAERIGAHAELRATDGWSLGDAGGELRAFTAAAPAPALPSDTAVLKLTSGSTGEPQAIAVTMEGLLADDDALRSTMGIGAGDRILGAIPFAHSYGLSSVVLPALRLGLLVAVPEGAHPLAPLHAARAAEITFLPTVPAFVRALVESKRPPAPPPSLRLAITAGAALDAPSARRFRARFGRPIHVFYGASECGGISFDRTGDAAERGTLGIPVEGVQVTLEPVSGDREPRPGSPEPRPGSLGVQGLVAVRSRAVASGYHPLPGPRLAGGRFLTEDLASFAAGELVLHGRRDQVINVKGKKVSPEEVEAVLRRHPLVADVAVFGVPQPDGRGEIVRAVLVPRGPELTAERLRQHCLAELAEHKVPRSLLLVDTLPRNERGKLDRAALHSLSGRELLAFA